MRRKDWADYSVERVATEFDEKCEILIDDSILAAFATELRRAYFRGLTHEIEGTLEEWSNGKKHNFYLTRAYPLIPEEQLSELHLATVRTTADDYETWVDPALKVKETGA